MVVLNHHSDPKKEDVGVLVSEQPLEVHQDAAASMSLREKIGLFGARWLEVLLHYGLTTERIVEYLKSDKTLVKPAKVLWAGVAPKELEDAPLENGHVLLQRLRADAPSSS